VLNQEIKRETGKAIPGNILDAAVKRIEFTYDPIASSLYSSAEDAYKLGFLGKKEPDLSNIYDLSILNGILKDKGLKEINVDSGQTAVK
jgi:NitT/TauT family transport system substrate-binding protein